MSGAPAADARYWITGSSSGIGRALVETAPAANVHLVGVSRSEPGALDLPDGATYEHLRADLSTPAGWEALRTSVRRLLPDFEGARAGLFHCAATISPIAFAAEVDPREYTDAVLLNAAAPLLVGQAFLAGAEHVADTVDTTLVLLSTGRSPSVYRGWSHYKAGKRALDEWARTAAAELAERGRDTTVLSVAPGVVDTGMQDTIRATAEDDFPDRERFVDLHEEGDLRAPHDVARELWSLLDAPPDDPVVDLRDL